MAPPGDELRQKLVSLASYADELDDWLANPPDPSRPRALQRVAERLLQVIVECAADAGDLWLAEHGHPLGESVRGVFQRLQEVGLVTPDVGRRFATYTTMRNRIVHDYDRVDAREVVDQASRLAADVRVLLAGLAST
jgi:uncharacterized protein YutE (UPF0331/DUF86 family)